MALRAGRDRRWIAFLIVAASLCWPIRMNAHTDPLTQVAEAIGWTIGLIAVKLADLKRGPQPSPAQE